MSDKLKIGILPEYPFFIAFGGLEVQCLETYIELKKIAPEVSLIDYFDKDADYNIIHFFGHPTSFKELYFLNAKKRKIILSTTLGAGEFSCLKKFIRRSTANIASWLREETNYGKYRYIFHNSNKIIVLNENEKNFLHKFYDVQKEKIIIIPNGVDKRYFSAKEDTFIKKYDIEKFVLFTGNIIQRKNPLLLAQVLKLIGIPGVFIGGVLPSEIKYANRFRKLVDSCNNLLWIEGLPHDDPLLVSAYSAATLFCLPSTAETQPISALEAMASGTPVILGDFTYAHQPPFEKTLKCNISDEISIKKNIKQVFEHRNDYIVPLSSEHTWENVAKKVLKVYKEVL